MKVTFVTYVYPYPRMGFNPGIERVVSELAHALTRKGIDLNVITTYRNGGQTKEEYDGDVRIMRINDLRNQIGKIGSTFSMDLLSINFYAQECINLLKQSDIIHAFTPFLTGPSGIPLVSHFHHREEICKGIEYLYQPTSEYFWRMTYKKSDAIASVSKYSSNDLMKNGIPESKIHTVYNGVDIVRFNPAIDSEIIKSKYEGKDILLYVGPISERKGLTYLIDAMPSIIKERKDAILILVGSGDNTDLIKKCVEYKIDKNVIFTGFIDEKMLPYYFSACDIFVLPSLQEGFGMVLLEAMACGKVVIASKTSAIPEVVGDAGILVEPKCPEAISAAVIDLLNDQTKRRDLEHKAIERARSVFTWDSVADRLIEVYKKISDDSGKSPQM